MVKKQGHQTVGRRNGSNTSLARVHVSEFNVNLHHHDASTARAVVAVLGEHVNVESVKRIGGGKTLTLRVVCEPKGLVDFPSYAQDMRDELEGLRMKAHVEVLDA